MTTQLVTPADGARRYTPNRAVLIVDDEQHLLDGLHRILRNHFDVTVALGPEAGLSALEQRTFAAVMSDLRMPGIDGISFLHRVGEKAPDTVRLLLTGFADVDSAIDAVNRGGLFRFLTKPVDFDLLRSSLDAAVAQYGLVVSEHELLEQTLRGSVQTLVDTLALADPIAFARATRLHQIVCELLDATEARDRWGIEVAALLSQLGMVTLPDTTASKLHDGQALDAAELKMTARLPDLAARLLGAIPRLDDVRDAIRLHPKHFDGSGEPPDSVCGAQLPLGARMLRLATDLDELRTTGLSAPEAMSVLRDRRGTYDPELLDTLGRTVSMTGAEQVLEVTVGQLRTGMRLSRDVLAANGALLVGRGHVVTEQLVERLSNYQRAVGIAEPIYATAE